MPVRLVGGGSAGISGAAVVDMLDLTGMYVLVLGNLKLCVEIPGSTYVPYYGLVYRRSAAAVAAGSGSLDPAISLVS